MPEVSIQGNQIHYLMGDNLDKSLPTLLFIHGAGQRATAWRFQEDVFANHPNFNFIALDLPGHGSSEGDGLGSVDDYKDFVLEFIKTLELSDVILIGHSMGGGVSMLLTIERPEAFRACILVGASAKLSVAQQTLDKVKNSYLDFCNISPARAFADDSPESLKQEYKKGLLNTKADVCYRDLIACDEFDILDDVEKINIPTLIISADKDIMTPPKRGEYLHQKIYGSEYYQIKGSGHFLMQEKAQEFNGVLIDFLNDLLSDTK